MIRQFARFASVGALATLIHVTVALILAELAGLSPQTANFSGFLSAVLFSYAGHLHFSFDVTAQHMVHGPRFAATALASYIASATIVFMVHDVFDFPFFTAMIAVGAVVPMATFWCLKLWAFAEETESSRDGLLGWALSAALAAGLLAMLWNTPINHDTSRHLISTKAWLEGADLYRDIAEVNPPLNFYYTAPAVLLADYLETTPVNGQYLLLSIVFLGVLGWCWRLLPGGTLPKRTLFLLLIAAALIAPFTKSIAQREHLMILLITPWIMGRVVLGASDAGDGKRALLAAFGLCLKPYFMFYPAALTLREVLVTRSLHPILAPANLIFIAAGLACIGAVAILHPLYFPDIIPVARHVSW